MIEKISTNSDKMKGTPWNFADHDPMTLLP
jgi:hypothetical protein